MHGVTWEFATCQGFLLSIFGKGMQDVKIGKSNNVIQIFHIKYNFSLIT